MSSMASAGFGVFIGVLLIGLYMTLFGLPGTIIIFLDVLAYALFTGFVTVGWKVLLLLAIFALISEGLDVLLGMTQTYKTPLKKSVLTSTLFGGLAGACILTPFFWGPGLWGGFFLGGLSGLVIIEMIRQLKREIPHQIPQKAFAALLGTKILKGSFALMMIFFSLSNIYT